MEQNVGVASATPIEKNAAYHSVLAWFRQWHCVLIATLELVNAHNRIQRRLSMLNRRNVCRIAIEFPDQKCSPNGLALGLWSYYLNVLSREYIVLHKGTLTMSIHHNLCQYVMPRLRSDTCSCSKKKVCVCSRRRTTCIEFRTRRTRQLVVTPSLLRICFR